MCTQSAGECYRLYREESFLRFAESQVPEIKRYISASFEPLLAQTVIDYSPRSSMRRANMASVVLQLKALGIQDVTRFDYMDPPPLDSRTRPTY